jgi:competence protein ComEA
MQHRFASVVFTAAALLVGSAALAADKPADSAAKPATGQAKTTAPAPAKGQAKPAQKDAKPKVVDINSASRDELKTLPGIGDAEADKIIAGRPYLSKAHLVTRNVLSEGQYYALKGRIKAVQKTGDPTKNTK